MIVDLSVLVTGDTPVYPGDPEPKVKPVGNLAKDGFHDHEITMGTHVGTHIDAPVHMIEGGKELNDIQVDQFVGRGRYVKVEDRKFDLEAVKQADIQKCDIVLFHTGLTEQYGRSNDYFEDYPPIPEDIAQYLVDHGVSMVGVDMCSPDHPDFPIHKLLLSNGVLIIENLTNLDKLAGKKFRVYALPLKLKVDGAPARVVAEVE